MQLWPKQSLIGTGYGLEGRGLNLRQGQDFSFLHSIQTGSRAHPNFYSMDTGDLSPGIKRPGREAYRSSPCCVPVKNYRAITTLPQMSLWRGAKLITHRNSFAFILITLQKWIYGDFWLKYTNKTSYLCIYFFFKISRHWKLRTRI
jgi:hypothetical protein